MSNLKRYTVSKVLGINDYPHPTHFVFVRHIIIQILYKNSIIVDTKFPDYGNKSHNKIRSKQFYIGFSHSF